MALLPEDANTFNCTKRPVIFVWCAGLTVECDIAHDTRCGSLAERHPSAIIRCVAIEVALAVEQGGGADNRHGTANGGGVSSEFAA
jgi:hypothetical protein